MGKEIEVKSQQELNEVCAKGDIAIVRQGVYEAYGSAQVTACGSAHVTACDSAHVTAYDSAHVTACDSAHVTACGSAQVRAYDSAQVRAYDSAHVTACGSAQVRAYDSAQVRAYDSAQVTACGSAQVRAYGSAQVTASKQVAVTITGKPKVTGGIQIKYKGPTTARQWLDNYGVKAVKGVVTLYKIVRDDFKSQYGTSYAPGSTPKADDWDGGKAECGRGLHFCPDPTLCIQFDSMGTKFIACPVKVSEIAVHKDPQYPTKIKAPRVCSPTWEVDIFGKSVKAKEPPCEPK